MFMRITILMIALFFTSSAISHEMTPTYPKVKPSYVDGVSVTTMELWNRRSDAKFYYIGVYDEEWNPIPFATTDKIIQVGYLEKKNFEIYFRNTDLDNIEYICTISKLTKDDVTSTGISSKICSRVR
jgi:hypothetical protein